MKMYHLVEAESLWALSQRGAVNLPQVKELQDKLRAAGHDPGASDGWYGQKTADAVKAYQQANGLKVDGDAGPQTLAKLGMAGAQQTKAVATPKASTPAKPKPRAPMDGGIAPGTTKGGPSKLRQRMQGKDSTAKPKLKTEPKVEPKTDKKVSSTPMPTIDAISSAVETLGMEVSDLSSVNENEIYLYVNPTEKLLKKYVNDKWIEYFKISSRDLDAGKKYWEQNLKTSPKMRINYAAHASMELFAIMVNEFGSVAKKLNLPPNTKIYFAPSRDNWDDFDLTWTGERMDFRAAKKQSSTSTKPEQEPKKNDKVDDTSFNELVNRVSNLDPPATAMYIGRFNDETNATYYFNKVKMSQKNPDVVIYLGGRRSAAPAELLRQQGRPRDSFSIYAFSLKENVGYNIVGRTDHDTLEDGLKAFEDAEIQTRSYNLNKGSTQYMRRNHLMRVLKTNPIPSQTESINRLSNLAGIK